MNKYKISIFILASFFIFECCIYSQLAMKLELNKKKYILYENIYATLKVKNLSANPIFFSQDKSKTGDLSFDITDRDGVKILSREKNTDFLSGTVIKEGGTVELTVSLSEFYRINKEGFYEVKAVIDHADLSSSYMSNSETFTVVSGIKVWESLVGVPTVGSLEGDAKIPERRYEIRSYFDGNSIVYCLVVSDKDYVYGVAEIGVDSGIRNPDCIIDEYSRLHVLALGKKGYYIYSVYDINCNLDSRDSYKKSDTIPSLNQNEKTGEIEVLGGSKIIEGLDNY